MQKDWLKNTHSRILYYKGNKYILPVMLFVIIIYLSYLSGNFTGKISDLKLCLKLNFDIKDIRIFWAAFASLSTLSGVTFAILKEKILDILFLLDLDLSLKDKKGIVLFAQDKILVYYHLNIKNKSHNPLKNVSVFCESVNENQKNILGIRRAFKWAAKDTDSTSVDIVNDDYIDFIVVEINLLTLEFHYRFELSNHPLNFANKFRNKLNAIINPSFLNKRIDKKYDVVISPNEEKITKLKAEIVRFKIELIDELKNIHQSCKKSQELKYESYPTIKLFMNEETFKSKYHHRTTLIEDSRYDINGWIEFYYIPGIFYSLANYKNFSEPANRTYFTELVEEIINIKLS